MFINHKTTAQFPIDFYTSRKDKGASNNMKNNETSPPKEDSRHVILSFEGLEKLKEEEGSLNKRIGRQIYEDYKKDRAKSEQSDKDPIDELIDNLKEKITDLNKKIKSLRYDNSNGAKLNSRMLNAQLVTLNGTLMSLMGKKIQNL
ncbi:hypothetical protein AADZ91_10070 [Colwelliaceae bacterium 6441]